MATAEVTAQLIMASGEVTTQVLVASGEASGEVATRLVEDWKATTSSLASGEEPRCGSTDKAPQLSTAALHLLTFLENPLVKNLLDWAPLIVFYALTSCMQFEFACFWGAAAGCVTILCTQVRSMLNPRVMSPKVLDVGFVVLFSLFAVASFSSPVLQSFVKTWYNSLTCLGLTLIVAGGNLFGSPFVLAYAREDIPVSVWENPNIQKSIMKGCEVASQQWVYLFLAMTIVTAVPPFVQVFRDGKISPSLNLWFGQVAQYAILALGLFKFMVWDKWKRDEVQARLGATAEMLRDEYGYPLKPTPVPATVNCPKGTFVANLVSSDLPAAAVVLRKAFWNDPMYTSWPGIGDLPCAEREAAMEAALACHLRQMERWGHIFGIFEKDSQDQSFLRTVIGCVPAWRGDETDLAWSPTSFAMAGWDGPTPADEAYALAEDRQKYLTGRPHLYIWLFGGDPEGHGRGFGRAALQHVLSIADERGVPAVLETCTLSNRTHYQNHGFKQISECFVPGCTEPWTFMVKEPQRKSVGYGSIV